MDDYQAFLARKAILDPSTGLAQPGALIEAMFPFQHDLTSWALRRGRAALFAGTGLGKSLIELAWAEALGRETQADVLHLTPLAVGAQMVREANKFHINGVRHVHAQVDCMGGTNITNYQKLEHFELERFGAVILDESSILKSYDGHYRTRLIEGCAHIPFRLAATATPAPNDFMELGNHAEFLGVMSYTDMLATFFTHDGGETQKWRLKGHAENDFWRWMASWAVMLRKPSDLGYSDEGYDLPPLRRHIHIVGDSKPTPGFLYVVPAETLQERLAARRETVEERVVKAFEVVTGRVLDKLAECGNQNTPEIDASEPSLTLSIALSETTRETDPTRKEGPNIIGSGTSKIESASENTVSPKPMSGTPGGANDTPPILSTQSASVGNPESAIPSSVEIPASGQPSELASMNMTPSSNNKAGDAPSAKRQRPTREVIGSTLITVTPPGASVGSFVPAATSAWASSEMIPSGFAEPWFIWCNLNAEQDALERLFGDACFSVKGPDTDAQKEDAIIRWLLGERPVMISKPTIMGFGMNFQHCSKTVFVGMNDSFEQVYQAVRRFWRFGQTEPVDAHFIASEREGNVLANQARKEADAERMAAEMVLHMADLSSQAVRGSVRDRPNYDPQTPMIIPSWLENAA